jgi:cell division protein ZapA
MTATVPITIAGRTYEIACDPGQEAMLSNLSLDVDRRARELLKAVGPVADTKLLVMVALTLADDVKTGAPPAAHPPAPAAPVDDGSDDRIAAGIDKLAKRIESIADQLQKA